MTRHFHNELERIKKMILSLSAIVEERVDMAVRAINEINTDLAEEIIKRDYEIDSKEVEIEEECLKAIALHQPVAIDLRFITAVIKINNDLERIGDQAVNIAERVVVIGQQERCAFEFNYDKMAKIAQNMLSTSLDAMINLDSATAYKVLEKDDDVDRFQNQAYDAFKDAMAENRACLGYLLNLFLISRHIERLADHTTNIAEEVIHMVEGEIIRHQPPTNIER